MLEIIIDEEFFDYEKNEDEEDEEEEEDYSSESEEEGEIEIESITDSNKPDIFVNDSNVASSNNAEVINSNDSSTIVFVDSENTPDPQLLNSDAESRADNIASALMITQLEEYSWIQSTVPEEEIQRIVRKLRIKKDSYDYLPRVFYVDKEDFDMWKEKDGDDHFFKWINGHARGKRTKTVASESTDGNTDETVDENADESTDADVDEIAGNDGRNGTTGEAIGEVAGNRATSEAGGSGVEAAEAIEAVSGVVGEVEVVQAVGGAVAFRENDRECQSPALSLRPLLRCQDQVLRSYCAAYALNAKPRPKYNINNT